MSNSSVHLETEGIFSTVANAILRVINPPKSGRLLANGRKLNVIDLFCGCGGFSLGLKRAGLHIIAGIDLDAEAIATYKINLPNVPHALQKDLTDFAPQQLRGIIGDERVDIIVGGPPCQGFSTARQRDGANHGKQRLIHDERRYLYQAFLLYVGYFQPKVFVIENVPGIQSAAGGEYYTRVQSESRALGYRVHPQVEDAWELGVPQKRRRQLIIGVPNNLPGYFLPTLSPPSRAIPRLSLGIAIGDLPVLKAGRGEHESEYDLARRERHIREKGDIAQKYLFRVLEINKATKLTSHVARSHSDRDLRDFKILREGETSAVAMRERGVKFEFPYDKSCFKDRYTRQSRRKPCSTIVAHLSKDGLMFIHPTQNRSLTPREVARVQSFPDWFRFPSSRTQAYRLIGNAVPPLVAESLGMAIKRFLRAQDKAFIAAKAAVKNPAVTTRSRHLDDVTCAMAMFRSRHYAVHELERLSKLDQRDLRELSKGQILRGWYALLNLLPELHPVNGRDHGLRKEDWPEYYLVLPGLPPKDRQRYVRSGWPVVLASIGREVWRRYEAHQLTDHEMYFSVAPDQFSEYQRKVLSS